MSCNNRLNSETDIHSDECNQFYQNYQNEKFLNYNLHMSAMNGDDRLTKISSLNTNVRNIGASSRGYNVNIKNNNLHDTIQTENWLFRLNRTLSNCPNLNDPNKDKICKSNELENINLFSESTRLSYPLYNYTGIDVYGVDQNGRNLNRYENIHNNRPPHVACVSIGTDTRLSEKDAYRSKTEKAK